MRRSGTMKSGRGGDAELRRGEIVALRQTDVDLRRWQLRIEVRAPTQAWTAQQLRNATPFGQGRSSSSAIAMTSSGPSSTA